MADRTINERVGSLEGARKSVETNLEALVKRLDELIEEVKLEKKAPFYVDKSELKSVESPFTYPPRRRGNPNWVKREKPAED